MVVFDASTLILLARIELLRKVAEEVEAIISEAVQLEATRKRTLDAKLIEQLVREGKLNVERVLAKKEAERLMSDFPIQLGEASSLVLALEKKGVLATDDGPTIRICKILQVKFVTALHFLIHLRERGLLSREVALAKLEKLSRYGRYHADIIRDATEKIKGGE